MVIVQKPIYTDPATGDLWQNPDGTGGLGGSGGGDASTVTYTPAVAADWNGSADPGDVDNALDQLAERTKDLEAAGSGGFFTVDQHQSAGQSTATSRGVALTSNVSANVKATSYTEIVASTSFDACGMFVFTDRESLNGDALLDIAFGAGGAEVVKIANLLVSCMTNRFQNAPAFFPIQVPAGTRISAKIQASAGSQAIRVSVLLIGGSTNPGLTTVTTYGAATGDSGGVSIDPGGTVNTKPATWTQIVASTSAAGKYLVIAIGNQANAARTTQNWLFDIAVGGSGAEVAILSNLPLGQSANHDLMAPSFICIPIAIASGVRLSARAQSDGNDAADRLFDLALYVIG